MRGGAARNGFDVTLPTFLIMCVGIGGNLVAISFVLREPGMGPYWAAASRFLAATAIFVVIARVAKAPFPRGRALVGALLYGALSFAAFFALGYWALEELPAGLAGVMFATVPLTTFLLALLQRQERFRWDSLAGAAVVVGGTAVIVGGADGGAPLLRLLAMLAAAACAAQGSIVIKGFPPVHPAAMNAIGMAVGTVVFFALMPVYGESVVVPQRAATWIAQLYLITFGSIGVFGLYLFVLRRWSASAVSYEFVLAPVVGILLSWWLLDEAITRVFVIGSVLVLAGVYLGALRPERRMPVETEAGVVD